MTYGCWVTPEIQEIHESLGAAIASATKEQQHGHQKMVQLLQGGDSVSMDRKWKHLTGCHQKHYPEQNHHDREVYSLIQFALGLPQNSYFLKVRLNAFERKKKISEILNHLKSAQEGLDELGIRISGSDFVGDLRYKIETEDQAAFLVRDLIGDLALAEVSERLESLRNTKFSSAPNLEKQITAHALATLFKIRFREKKLGTVAAIVSTVFKDPAFDKKAAKGACDRFEDGSFPQWPGNTKREVKANMDLASALLKARNPTWNQNDG